MSSPPAWLTQGPKGSLRLQVLIQAGARAHGVVGEHAGCLKLKIAAPPVDGAANKALVAFLAKALGVRQQQVKIVQGGLAKRKLIEVDSGSAAALDLAAIAASLLALAGPP